MTTGSNECKFEHDPAKTRFIMEIQGVESVAVAEYNEIKSGGTAVIYDVIHTEVPSSLRGRGIGAQLMRNIVSYARSNNIKIVPTCSYVAHYFAKNPTENDVLYPCSNSSKSTRN